MPLVSLRPRAKLPALLVLGLLAVGVLVACSGGSTKVAASNEAATSPSDGAGRGGFGLRGLLDDPKVKQCLDAAGITIPTPTFTGARPSFTGPRPSFGPGERPTITGAPPSGFGGRGFDGQNSAEFQKIRQALDACGIALPTRSPRPGGTSAHPAPSSTTSG